MSTDPNNGHHGDNPSGYEKSDVDVKGVAIFSLATIAFIVVCLIGLNDYFMIAKETEYYESFLKPESTELRQMQAEENAVLTSYGVVDKNKGVYRVPVEHAMKLMAEEHFEAQKKQ